MANLWEKARPSIQDSTHRLDITYQDDEDIFALFGIDSSWVKPRLQSKYTAILVIAMMAIMILLAFVANSSILYFACGGVMVLIVVILEILLLLGMNRAALKEVLRSFKFLFKMYEGVVFQVYFILNDYHLNPSFDWPLRIGWALETALLIFLIAALDASSLNYTLKWMMTAVLASAFTGCAITYRFDWFGYGEHVVDVVDVTEIQTKEALVKAAQVLAIFYWQQALSIFRGGPTGESATIRYNPYIKWALADAGKAGKEKVTVDSVTMDSVQSGQTVQAP